MCLLATAGLGAVYTRWKTPPPGGSPSRFCLPLALLILYLLFSVLSLGSAVNKAEAFWQLAQSPGWSAWFLLGLAAGAESPSSWTAVRRTAVASALLGAGFSIGEY